MGNKVLKIKINKNKKEVKRIQREIKANSGFCICSIVHDNSTKCMCESFRNQNYEGECHCGLYYKTYVDSN